MNLLSKFGYCIITQTLNIALCKLDGITDRQRRTESQILQYIIFVSHISFHPGQRDANDEAQAVTEYGYVVIEFWCTTVGKGAGGRRPIS